MADKKISALTGATTPLTGSEVLPIVQGGSTVKVSVDNLTTGKAVTVKSLGAVTGLSGATQATDITISRTSSTGVVLTGPNIYFDDGTANNTIAIQNGAGALQVFGYNGSWSTRLTLDNTGNLGLGVVPSAWVSGQKVLEVSGFSINAAAADASLTVNGYVNSSYTWVYKATGFSTRYESSSGEHKWFTAPSGPAGNPFVYTQVMGIDTSGNTTLNTGNVVIGTAGKGIDFSANTNAAGMTSELLNWYETGTWTPSLGGNTTYVTQDGTYTRVGNLVHVEGKIIVNVLGTGSPTTVSGLPFTVKNTTNSMTGKGVVGYFAGIATSLAFFAPDAIKATNTFYFEGTTGAVTTATNGPNIFTGGTRVDFALTYLCE